jgi:hypothetical protein
MDQVLHGSQWDRKLIASFQRDQNMEGDFYVAIHRLEVVFHKAMQRGHLPPISSEEHVDDDHQDG